jgi:hypothetical protein
VKLLVEVQRSVYQTSAVCLFELISEADTVMTMRDLLYSYIILEMPQTPREAVAPCYARSVSWNDEAGDDLFCGCQHLRHTRISRKLLYAANT